MDNYYVGEFELRKQAVKAFLSGDYTQKEICIRFGKDRSWLRYWFKQYQINGLEGLHLKVQGYPKGKVRKYASRLIDEIVGIRHRLEENPQEYFYGAQRIYQEFVNLGYGKEKFYLNAAA